MTIRVPVMGRPSVKKCVNFNTILTNTYNYRGSYVGFTDNENELKITI